MTDLHTAARQALEALRDAADAIAGDLENPGTAMHNALIAESALRAALEAQQEPVPDVWLSRDEARLALWDAITRREFGNPTDDKLILEHLHKKGLWIGKYAVLAELLAELDGERARSQMYADLVRGVAVVLHGEGWSDTSKLPEEVARLRAEVEALRKDAERLNFLASECEWNGYGLWLPEWAIAVGNEQAPTVNDLRAAIDAAKGGEHCRYPDCNCPFDAPADPNWCAKGLPQKAKGGGNG